MDAPPRAPLFMVNHWLRAARVTDMSLAKKTVSK
jgi:hypothetical protein